ncbi:MAG TPA: thioredoxin family protein [Methylomirabilota bacterium]|nr:thioredoxin family protein [Methylomirabilota bacterium]
MITAERFAQGMTLSEYLDQMRINKERFVRFMSEAAIADEDREALRRLGPGLRVLVITEDWCGDALYSFPALARLVEGEPGVEMRVFLRDRNPDVMDRYLKRGTFRTIPVFVFYDERMNELARFTERQDVVSELHTLAKV